MQKVHSLPKPIGRDPNAPPEKCPFCPKTYLQKRYLTDHIQRVHDGSAKVYQCQECDHTTQFPAALRKHVNIIHRNMGTFHECSLCLRKWRKKEQYLRHFKNCRRQSTPQKLAKFQLQELKIVLSPLKM